MLNLRKLIKRFRDVFLICIVWRKYDIDITFRPARGVRIWGKDTVKIGRHVYMGKNSQIESNIIIKDYVLIANNVAFVGKYDHNFQQIGKPIIFSEYIRQKDYNWNIGKSIIIVNEDVWIGYGCIILSNVTIGRGSIIAGGSVVTKDVEPYSIYAGTPAKKIGSRFKTPQDLAEHIKLFNENYLS